MKKQHSLIRDFLEEKVIQYNTPAFIELDPISIPHLFSKKEDIEIAGFFAASIAWGNRKSILTNANNLMKLMDMAPHDFIVSAKTKDLKVLEKFVHRTFNGKDCIYFVKALQHIYQKHGGLEKAFETKDQKAGLKNNILAFREKFLALPHENRIEKHVSDPSKKSSAKRLCMYLRWMARDDRKGVDFGIWKKISPANLCLPLDVHTGNISRQLGLLSRKQNDWQAVEELTEVLKTFDPKDPVKYDFALFGIGVNKDLDLP